jgi:predicted ATP-binding protein involved in virulence
MAENEKRSGYLKERQRLLQDKTTPHLPFALSRIEIVDFQGIKHLIINNIPVNAQWIFLTGENGFGKTSILRAIAKGLVGDEALVEWLPEKSRIYLNGYNWNHPFFYSAQTKKTPNNDFQMAGYGASRFQLSSLDQIETSNGKTSQKTYSLFYDNGILKNIERVLIDTERDDLPTFNHLKAIFLTLIPNLADLKSELIGKKRCIRYYEKNDQGEIYAPVLLHELAAGYRGILTMIGDMIQRLLENPNNSLDDLQGIVIIDEIDAHLHPKYQYELPKLLSDVFPKIQFIASTHSPIPLLGVNPNTSVVLTVHRSQSTGILVERLDDAIEIERLSANALFTSDIFNFKNIFARGATPDTS